MKKFSKAKVNYRKHERKEFAGQERRAGKTEARTVEPIDPQKPPICEEDNTEMELGMNPQTGMHAWCCPECGWSYDTENSAL